MTLGRQYNDSISQVCFLIKQKIVKKLTGRHLDQRQQPKSLPTKFLHDVMLHWLKIYTGTLTNCN